MRILIDTRTVGREFSGVGNYVFELMRAFASLDVDHRFFLVVHRDSSLNELNLDERFSLVESAFSHESHPLGDLWEEFVLPRCAEERRADIIHGPAFLIPNRRIDVAKVSTVHDLVAFSHPETIPRKYALYMRWLIKRAVRESRRVITVSESVRGELCERLGANPDRVDCIHHGVADRFHPPDEAEVERVRRAHGLDSPYLLFVGNLEPRKNLPGLLAAFRLVRERHPGPLELLVAGKVGWLSGPLLAELEAEDLRGFIRTTGFVEPADLPALYRGSEAFVFPTFWEGFGLPVLEAMAAGTPVVTSDRSSLPEVAGNAAVLVDPHSPDSIAEGVFEAIEDPDRRAELIRRGRRRAAEFT